MSFDDPVWLYLTPILLLVFGAMIVYGFRRRDSLLGRFAATRLLDQLTEKASFSRSWIKAACILIAVIGIGVSLARPQLGVEWSERKARGLDIVFVLDSSKSMLATDLRPTRLERAKLAIIDLVERLESDRIGLVAFAGQAFLQTPPTLDYSAFRESLDATDPSSMTSGGSDLGNALTEAAEAFPSENNVKVVVLLTDGEDLSGNAAQAAEAAQKDGIQVFAIGIGTPEGDYLKVRNAQGIEEFVRDSNGQPVRSQLDEATLQSIAQATGGSYSRLSGDTLDQLYSSVLSTLPREERESELQEIKIERFQWALSLATILLISEILIRRRRNTAIQATLIILTALTVLPNDTHAQEAQPTDPRRIYNSANEALSSGEYDTAIQGYENAIAQSDNLKLQQDALYNMAHATYQQGRTTYSSGDPQAALEQVKKAEELFQSAQEIDPSDTSINQDIQQVSNVREMIEKLLEQQQEQEQENQDSEEDSQDSEENDENSQEDQESQENSEDGEQQENQESQDSESEENQGDESQQDSESSEDSSSDSQEGQENQDSSSEGEESGSESDSENQEPSTEESEGEESQSGSEESTEDPVDDIPEQQPNQGEEQSEEEGESSSTPEPTEGEEGEGQSSAAVSGEQIEGMSEAEAAALLDSLQGKETLLPFIDQKRGGKKRDVRDW